MSNSPYDSSQGPPHVPPHGHGTRAEHRDSDSRQDRGFDHRLWNQSDQSYPDHFGPSYAHPYDDGNIHYGRAAEYTQWPEVHDVDWQNHAYGPNSSVPSWVDDASAVNYYESSGRSAALRQSGNSPAPSVQNWLANPVNVVVLVVGVVVSLVISLLIFGRSSSSNAEPTNPSSAQLVEDDGGNDLDVPFGPPQSGELGGGSTVSPLPPEPGDPSPANESQGTGNEGSDEPAADNGTPEPLPENKRLAPNEPYTSGKWSYTPHDIVDGELIDQTPALCVAMTVRSEDEKDSLAPLFYFSAISPEGKEYFPALSASEDDLMRIEVNATGAERGVLCFDAPPTEGTYRLVFSPVTYPKTTTEWEFTR